MNRYEDFYAEVSEKDGFDSIMYKDVCRIIREVKNIVSSKFREIGLGGGKSRGVLDIILEGVYEEYGVDGLKITAHRMIMGYIYKYLFNEKRFITMKTAGKVFHETTGIPLDQRSMMIGEVLRGKNFDNINVGQGYKELKQKLDSIIRSEGLTGFYQALKDRDLERKIKEVFEEKIVKIMSKWHNIYTASSNAKKEDMVKTIISIEISIN